MDSPFLPQHPWHPCRKALWTCEVTLQEWADAAQIQGKAHADRLHQQAAAAETEAIWAEREVEYWSEWVPREEDLRDWSQAWHEAWQ